MRRPDPVAEADRVSVGDGENVFSDDAELVPDRVIETETVGDAVPLAVPEIVPEGVGAVVDDDVAAGESDTVLFAETEYTAVDDVVEVTVAVTEERALAVDASE